MMQEVSNYAGFVLGVVSILATIYYARKYSERKSPMFYTLSEHRISRSDEAPDDIAVSYKGKNVDHIYATMVWFWNGGKRPILQGDLPSTEPLCIVLSDNNAPPEILDVIVRKTSRDAIGFTAQKHGDNIVRLGFSFLDHNDGALIEILHTGSYFTDIRFDGIILGAPKGVPEIVRSGLFRLLLPFPYPGRALLRHGNPTFLSRLASSAITTAIFGTMILFLLYSVTDITTTKARLLTQLTPFVSESSLEQAIAAVISGSKFHRSQTLLTYVMSGFFFVTIIFGYFVTWRRSFPFPNALVIDDPKPGEPSINADAKP